MTWDCTGRPKTMVDIYLHYSDGVKCHASAAYIKELTILQAVPPRVLTVTAEVDFTRIIGPENSMLLTLVLASLVSGSLQAGLPDGHVPINPMMSGPAPWIKPWFCHGLDCPVYTVTETNTEFETRMYEPSVWVATKMAAFRFTEKESRSMFYKLFNYIAGNNTANMKIAMTAPVVTEVKHGPGPDCESNFTMHFMLPFDLQANPPAPTEDGVYIAIIPQTTVYARGYGGVDSDDLKRENIETLIASLDAANKQYSHSEFLTATYDGPYTFTDRHNEIWALAV